VGSFIERIVAMVERAMERAGISRQNGEEEKSDGIAVPESAERKESHGVGDGSES